MYRIVRTREPGSLFRLVLRDTLLIFILWSVILRSVFIGDLESGKTGTAVHQAVPGQIHVRCHGATAFERDCAVRAAGEVEGLYRKLGFFPVDDPGYHIFFMDTLNAGEKTIDWALGVYCCEKHQVLMSHYDGDIFQRNERFEGCNKEDIYFSIVAHEIAHHYNACISPGLLPPVDEAIAGFVQYTLMDPELRRLQLAVHPAGMHSYREMVMSRYINDPDEFLASSYLYLRDHPLILKRWLNGQGPFPKDPFLL